MSQSQQLLQIPREFCAALQLPGPIVCLFSGSLESRWQRSVRRCAGRVRRGSRSRARARRRAAQGDRKSVVF